MGPHHCNTPEPLDVNPKTFSLEGMWNNEKCPQYNINYNFVRYGIDK